MTNLYCKELPNQELQRVFRLKTGLPDDKIKAQGRTTPQCEKNQISGGKKMRKKALATMLVLSMAAVGLAGCGSSDTAATTQAPAATEAPATTQAPAADAGTEAAAPAADSGELIRVGIINNDPNESGYRTANDADLKAMFTKENGYDASFAYSLKNDEQITAAQKFIQDEVDYLLLSAADTSGWDSVLKDAQDAGIGVILFDRTIDASEDLYLASIVSDMNKAGETAVKWPVSSTHLPSFIIKQISRNTYGDK